MKNKLLLIIIFLMVSVQVYAQTRVVGHVQDDTGYAIPGVTVVLKGMSAGALTNTGAVTNIDGDFDMAVKSKGTYELEVRYVGYKSISQTLELVEDKTYNLGVIQMEEDGRYLQTVEVIGRAQEDYNSDYSFSASKVAMKNREMPQAISSVTKELIADRQAFQLSDAVKTVSSVTSTGNYNHFNIRGITQAEDGQSVNGMRTRQYYFLQPITSHIERVEVIKGPSSVTFSSADPGGTVNMVTKKPLAEKRNEVSFSAGSFGTIRTAADFTGPLNESKTLLYRLNAGFQEAQSFRDLVQNNALLVTPSISYVPNSTTAFNAEIIYSNGNGNLDRGQPTFGRVTGQEFDLDSTPISMNVGAADDYYKSEELTFMTSFKKDFADNVGFNASYMKQTWKEDLVEHRVRDGVAAVDTSGNVVPTLAKMQYVERKQYWETDNFNAYINVDIESGSITNKVLVGYDLSTWERTKGGTNARARGYRLADGGASRSYSGVVDDYLVSGNLPVPNVPHFDLENPNNGTRATNDYIFTRQGPIPANLTTSHGVYIQNQFKIGKLSALFNLRYEWFEDIYDFEGDNELTYNNEAFIPRVGVTYEVTNNISAYATYLQGVQPQTNTVSLSPATENFFWGGQSPSKYDPLETESIELGFKGEFFKGRLQANFSVYDITQENMLVLGEKADGNPWVWPEQLDSLKAIGGQSSRGFEFDVYGYVLPNFQMVASYGYTDAKIDGHADEALVGARTGGSAIHSANFWGKYDFTESILKGFSIGLGAQYSGDKYTWYFKSEDERVRLPSYTTLEGALYYSPNDSDIQFTLKVNNLTDEKYWNGGLSQYRLAPGAPRNYLMTVTYKF